MLRQSPEYALLIRRQRVLERLSRAARHRCVLIAAPAGYGKSVALRHYLDLNPWPSVRLNLQAEHGRLASFVRALAEAAHEVAPTASGAVGEVLVHAGSADDPAHALALWMEHHLAGFTGTIAIDDLHHLEPHAQTTSCLRSLIERTPEIRWVLAGRTLAHLPIASWIAYGDADVPITEDLLAFTPQEAHEAAAVLAPSLESTAIDHLQHLTRGWPTACSFALRIAEHSHDLFAATASARGLTYQYLAEQIFNTLCDEDRELLLCGALLPRVDAAVLEGMGLYGAAARLHALHHRVTFLTPEPDARDATFTRRYRYHDLFREFLTFRLTALSAERIRELRLRAAQSFATQGDYVCALVLLIEAHACAEIAQLLIAHGAELLDNAHGELVQSALDALPEPLRNTDAAMLFLRAKIEERAGQFHRARLLMEEALTRNPSDRLRARLAIRLAQVRTDLGEDALPLLEATVAQPALPVEIRGDALAQLAYTLAIQDVERITPAMLDEIETCAARSQADAARTRMLQMVGVVTIETGEYERGRRVLHQALDIAMGRGLRKHVQRVHATLSVIAALEGDFPRAQRHAQAEAEIAEVLGEPQMLALARAREAWVLIRTGDHERLHALLEHITSSPMCKSFAPSVLAMVERAYATIAAWNGDFANAHRRLEPAITHRTLPEDSLYNKALCALFLAADGERERAQSLVEDAMSDTRIHALKRPTAARSYEMSRAVCALTEVLCGRTVAAMRLLHAKPRTQTPLSDAFLGLAAAVVREMRGGALGTAWHSHLEGISRHHHGGDARAIKMAFATRIHERRPESPLTPTELRVLRLVAAGNKPKEIASETGCSVHTVRGHLQRIIAKFGCSGREQAIRIAQSRDLL